MQLTDVKLGETKVRQTGRILTYLLELLAEIVVEPGVEEWIVTGAAHGDAVRHEEAQLVVVPVVRVRVEVVDDVDDVERHPGHAEYDDHRDQHAIRAALPLAVRLLALAGLAAGLGARPVLQLDRHAGVAEGDDEERHGELQYRGEQAEDLAERLVGPVLLAEDLRLLQLHVEPVRQG